MSLPITSVIAGVLGTAYALASFSVALTRIADKKLHGAEANTRVYNRSRAAGTIGEYGTIGILLLALLEFNNVLSRNYLLWWGLGFTIFRVLHAFQLSEPKSRPLIFRGGSFIITIGLLLTASVLLFLHGIKH